MRYIKTYITLLITFLFCLKPVASDNLSHIKKLLEGRYELVSWVQNNIEFSYPKVAGTLIVNNNQISFTLDNYIDKKKVTKIIAWGEYTLSLNSFNYEYFKFNKMTTNKKKISINSNLPWKGKRNYEVKVENDILILSANKGKQTWRLNNESLVYKDKEWGSNKKEIIRYWKRIR